MARVMTDDATQTRQDCFAQQTRRHFFARLRRRPGVDGPGARCSTTDGLRGRSRRRATANPLAVAARPLPGAGQERHLPVHGGRAQPARAVRLQARAPEVHGQPIPDSFIKGRRFAFMDIFTKEHPKLLGTSRKFAQPRPVGRLGLGVPAAPGRGGRRPGLRPLGGDRRLQPRPGQAVRQHRLDASSAGRAWAPGSPTASAASRTSLPGFVVLQSGPRGPRGGAVNWGSGFLPSAYQGVPLRSGGEPILNLATPAGHLRAQPAADDRRDLASSNRARLDVDRRPRDRHADRRLRDGLPDAVERPGADRPAARETRRDAANCTAPSRASRRSPTTACWPAGWSSGASGSSSSITPTGTTTASPARP